MISKKVGSVTVHSNGSVTKNGQELTGMTTPNGYVVINFDGQRHYMHRLVYQTFIGDIPRGMEIDHADGNPLNNDCMNLRCVTKSQNRRNPVTVERYREANKGKRTNPRQVEQCDLEGNVIKVYDTIAEAGRDGYSASAISQVVRGVFHTHKGFIWRYVA